MKKVLWEFWRESTFQLSTWPAMCSGSTLLGLHSFLRVGSPPSGSCEAISETTPLPTVQLQQLHGDRVRVAELLLLGFGLAENAEDDEEWEAFHDSTNSIRKFRIQKSRIQNDRSGFIAKIGDNPDFKIQIWKIFWKILKFFPDLTNWNHPNICQRKFPSTDYTRCY